MKIYHLIKSESDRELIYLFAIGVISGACNTLLLVIINNASERLGLGKDNTLLFLECMVVIILYFVTKRYVLRQTIALIQNIVNRLRVRIVNKVRRAELQMVEEIGQGKVYARITEDTQDIAKLVASLAAAFQAAIMVIFTVIYVGILSFPSFIALLIGIALGYFTYMRTGVLAKTYFKQASIKEAEFFDALNQVLLGFKEIRINKKKNDEVFDNFRNVNNESIMLRVLAKFTMITSQLFSQSFFYLLLVIIIFILPTYHEITYSNVIKISAAILFLVGPIESVIKAIPNIFEANIAADNILDLETKLESYFQNDENGEVDHMIDVDPLELEQEIRIENLQFSYPPLKNESKGFSVGPIDMVIPKGKVTFITGGNGAGESTFLKLFCGLYVPSQGSILVDDIAVKRDQFQAYREMLSIIFADFYLFDKLYGLSEIDNNVVQDLMKMMRLETKTQIIEGRITEMNLSTGQKKRLALLVSILEDKQVYVFDEVAADQDPTFKKFFYTDFLQQMKAKNKTVVVVTHDDHYFNEADHLYKLENGQIVDI